MLVKISAFILALAILLQMTLLIDVGSWYYLLLLFNCLVVIPFEKVIRLNFNVILFAFALLLSIAVNDIPTQFKPYERLISLSLLLILFGPSFLSKRKIKFNYYLLKFFIPLLYISQVFSFALFLSDSQIVFGRGGYTGLFAHSMIMGPLSAISFLFSFHYFLTTKKLSFSIICIISLMNILLSSSRAALIALVIAVIVLLYFHSSNQAQFLKKLLVIILILFLFYPFLSPYLEGIIKKIEFSQSNGSLAYTRLMHWDTRISEFLESPIFGIGYANDSRVSDLFYNSNDSGTVEPGSSWLVILSMSGIFGFIFFLKILHSSLKKIKLNYKNSKVLVSVIIFYLVHFFAEGFVISGGSGLNLFFWLTLGILYSYNPIIVNETK